MHIIITTLYGATIWLPLLAYALITGAALWPIVLAGPLVISGAALGLILLDRAILKLRKLWS